MAAPLSPNIVAHRLVSAASGDLAAYAGSDVSTAAVRLVDALTEAYKIDLVTIKPEDLLRVQTSIRQLQALRGVLTGERPDAAKI
jgi:hypothetical protein